MASESAFRNMEEKFTKLSLREKNLVLLAGLAIVGAIFFFLLIEPVLLDSEAKSNQLAQKQRTLETLDQQVGDLTIALKNDPDKELKGQKDKLVAKNEQLDNTLNNETASLVPAKKMPLLLERVLNSRRGLKLVSMESIAPVPLLSDKEVEGQKFNLYQHGVKLIIEGKYFDVQRYLEDIEGSQWKFYWRNFVYQVDKYPLAQVEIELYTLSTSSAFIGV